MGQFEAFVHRDVLRNFVAFRVKDLFCRTLNVAVILAVAGGQFHYDFVLWARQGGVRIAQLRDDLVAVAPMTVVGHDHSVDAAACGIQWHILAMLGSSFFTGRLLGMLVSDKLATSGKYGSGWEMDGGHFIKRWWVA